MGCQNIPDSGPQNVGSKPLSSNGYPRELRSALYLLSYRFAWNRIHTHRNRIGQTTSVTWHQGPQSYEASRRTLALSLRSAGLRLWARATERPGQEDIIEEVPTSSSDNNEVGNFRRCVGAAVRVRSQVRRGDLYTQGKDRVR
jgi:hypothetical protein